MAQYYSARWTRIRSHCLCGGGGKASKSQCLHQVPTRTLCTLVFVTPSLSATRQLRLIVLVVLLLYHFELFGRSRVTDPPDGAEIGCCHESHWCLPAVTYSMWQRNKKKKKRLNKRPKFELAESRNSSMSPISLASAEAKFRRSGHGSQAMPNNSKWYSIWHFLIFTANIIWVSSLLFLSKIFLIVIILELTHFLLPSNGTGALWIISTTVLFRPKRSLQLIYSRNQFVQDPLYVIALQNWCLICRRLLLSGLRSVIGNETDGFKPLRLTIRFGLGTCTLASRLNFVVSKRILHQREQTSFP